MAHTQTRTESRFLTVLAVFFLVLGVVVAVPAAQAVEYDPSFTYERHHDHLFGQGWDPGLELTVTSSDGRSWTVTPGSDHFAPNQIDLHDLMVAPGSTITVSNTEQSKSLLVTDIEVTRMDPRSDVFEGFGPPGETVLVGPDGQATSVIAGDGTWSVDLSTAGIDALVGMDGYAAVDDTDGDSTRWDWDLSEIIVNAVSDEIWLSNFHHVNITVLLGGDGTLETSSLQLDVEHDGAGNAYLDLYGEFDIAPGMDVYAWGNTTGGPQVRHHVVTNLTLDSTEDQILSGTADPGSEVCIDTFGAGEECIFADSLGAWSYDPGVEGAAAVAQYDDDADSTQLKVVGPAWFLGDQVWDSLWGHNFAANASVDVTIDGTHFGTFGTDRGGFFAVPEGTPPLEIGSHVVVTDGLVTKDLLISDLLVTDVDPDTNEVHGTGTAGAEIWIGNPNDPAYAASRTVVIGPDGTWSTDFDDPGDGGATWDFGPGDSGFTHQNDSDGDVTHVQWYAAEPPPLPWLTADAGTDSVWGGGGWLEGVPITVTIDDPATGESPDFTGTTELGTYPDPNLPEEFYLEPSLDILPGFTIEATDGTTTKDLTVTSLDITDVDFENDLVHGTADDGIPVHIDGGTDEANWAFRLVDPSDGAFTADFANPGTEGFEQETADLVPGAMGTAQQHDEDGDYTHAFWGTEGSEMPWMSADLDSGWVWGGGPWEIGVPITVTVDDPATGESPDFSGTTEMLPTDWDPGCFEFSLDTGFDIQAGFTVEATDGAMTKSLIVADIHDVVIDPDTAIVTGFTDPDSWVNVNLGNEFEWAWRDMAAGGDGFFSADLGTPVAEGESGDGVMTTPLPEGTGGAVQVFDDDGDSTHSGICHGCGGGEPKIAVFPDGDRLQLEGDWEPGLDVTITVDDDQDAGNGVLYSETIFDSPGDGFSFEVSFDVERGHWVAADDGAIRKEHQVTNLFLDGYDLHLETVFGRADAGSVVIVQVAAAQGGEVGSHRIVTAGSDLDDGVADGLGPWLADFSIPGGGEGPQDPFDLQAGTHIVPEQRDEDGDETDVESGVPQPRFQVDPDSDFVWGQEWPEGATVTISVYDDIELTNLLHGTAAPVERWGDSFWDVGFNADLGYDVVVGHVVTVSDGDVTKTLVVSNLHGVAFDADTGAVSGYADPFAWVEVNAGNEFEWAWRNVQADGDGYFAADLGTPVASGEGDGVMTVPLAEGTGGEVRIPDEDQDSTTVGFCHACGDEPYPTVQASLTNDWIELHGWFEDTSVTIEVVGHFGPQSFTVGDGHGWIDSSTLNVDLEPGMTVVATGDQSGVIKELTLLDGLSIIYFEAVDDLMYGTAPPDALVEVGAGNEDGGCGFEVQADTAGYWEADFAAEPCFFDITEDMGGNALTRDPDGDATLVEPSGAISVTFFGNDEGQPRVDALGWPLGEMIHLTVTDATGTVLYESDALVEELNAPYGPPFDTTATFPMGDFWVERGDIVTVSHPSRISRLNVSHIRIDTIDLVADTVSGSGAAGPLHVFAGPEFQGIDPASDGTWSVSFSDLGRNTQIAINDLGYHTGWTRVEAGAEQQGGLLVNLDPSWLWLFDDGRFPSFATGVVEVYADAADELPVWTTSVTTNEFGGFTMDPLGYEMLPGLSVRVEFGDLDRIYTEVEIVDLAMTGFDANADLIAGTAPGHDEVWVRPALDLAPGSDTCGTTYPVVDGVWTVDYTAPGECQGFDLQWGSQVLMALFHDNGDMLRRVQQANSAPEIGEITAPLVPIESGYPAAVSAPFTDPDATDTHTAVWDWGDGTGSEGVVEFTDGAGTVTGEHTYSVPGVYTLVLTVEDQDGAAEMARYQYVVVYDSDAGHVTGGGWIPLDGDKANFGLTARYKKGTPVGEFNSVIDGVHLHSDAIDWLVITPEQTAHLYGAATLNGYDGFDFRADVGDHSTGESIRIRVWSQTGELIHDIEGTLGGGQIKIHE